MYLEIKSFILFPRTRPYSTKYKEHGNGPRTVFIRSYGFRCRSKKFIGPVNRVAIRLVTASPGCGCTCWNIESIRLIYCVFIGDIFLYCLLFFYFIIFCAIFQDICHFLVISHFLILEWCMRFTTHSNFIFSENNIDFYVAFFVI